MASSPSLGRAGPPRRRSWRSEAPQWATGFAQSYLDIGAILPTGDGRSIGNATVLAVEPHDEFGFVVKLVTDAGNDVRMTEREVHTAFHRPKWIRRIDTPADRMRRADAVLAEVRAEVENAISKCIRYVVDLRRE